MRKDEVKKAMIKALLEKWWGWVGREEQEGKKEAREEKEPPLKLKPLSLQVTAQLKTEPGEAWYMGKPAFLVTCPYCKEDTAVEGVMFTCPQCYRVSYLGAGGELKVPPRDKIHPIVGVGSSRKEKGSEKSEES